MSEVVSALPPAQRIEIVVKTQNDSGGGFISSLFGGRLFSIVVLAAIVIAAVMLSPNLSGSLNLFGFDLVSGGGGHTEAAPPQVSTQNWYKYECSTFGKCINPAMNGTHALDGQYVACTEDQFKNRVEEGTCISKESCSFSSQCNCSKVCPSDTLAPAQHVSMHGNVMMQCPQGCGTIPDMGEGSKCCVCDGVDPNCTEASGVGGYPSLQSCEQVCQDVVLYNDWRLNNSTGLPEDNPFYSRVRDLAAELTTTWNADGNEKNVAECFDLCTTPDRDACFDASIAPVIEQPNGRGMANRAFFRTRATCEYAIQVGEDLGELPEAVCDGGNIFSFKQSLCGTGSFPACDGDDCRECITAQLNDFTQNGGGGQLGQCYPCSMSNDKLACGIHADYEDITECEQACGNPYVLGTITQTEYVRPAEWIQHSRDMGVCIISDDAQFVTYEQAAARNEFECSTLAQAFFANDGLSKWIPMYSSPPEPVILNLATALTVREINTYIQKYHQLGDQACEYAQQFCTAAHRQEFVRQLTDDDKLISDGIPDPYAVRLLDERDFAQGENHVFHHGQTFYNAERPQAGPVFTVDQARALELNLFAIQDLNENEEPTTIIPHICTVGEVTPCNPGPAATGDEYNTYWPRLPVVSDLPDSAIGLPLQCDDEGLCATGEYAVTTGRVPVTDIIARAPTRDGGLSSKYIHGYAKYTLQSLTDSFEPISNVAPDSDFNDLWLANNDGDGHDGSQNEQKPPNLASSEAVVSGQFWTPFWSQYKRAYENNQSTDGASNLQYGPNFCGCTSGFCTYGPNPRVSTEVVQGADWYNGNYYLSHDLTAASLDTATQNDLLLEQRCGQTMVCLNTEAEDLSNPAAVGYVNAETENLSAHLQGNLDYSLIWSQTDIDTYTAQCRAIGPGYDVHVGQFVPGDCNNCYEEHKAVETTCSPVGQFRFRDYLLTVGLNASLIPKGYILIEWNNDTAAMQREDSVSIPTNPDPATLSGDVCQGKGPLGDTVRKECADMSTSVRPDGRMARSSVVMGFGKCTQGNNWECLDAELANRGRTMIAAGKYTDESTDGACASTVSYPQTAANTINAPVNAQISGPFNKIKETYAWQQQVRRGPLINNGGSTREVYSAQKPPWTNSIGSLSEDLVMLTAEATGGLSNLGYNEVEMDMVGSTFAGLVQNYPLPSGWISHTMLTDTLAQTSLNKFADQVNVHGQVSSFCNVDIRAQAGDNPQFATYLPGTKLTQVAFWKAEYLNALLDYYRQFVMNAGEIPKGSFPEEPLKPRFIYTKDGWYERSVEVNQKTGGIFVKSWWQETDRAFGRMYDDTLNRNPYENNSDPYSVYLLVNKLYMHDLPDELVRIHPRLFPSFNEGAVNNEPAFCQSRPTNLNGARCVKMSTQNGYCCSEKTTDYPKCADLNPPYTLPEYRQELLGDTNPGTAKISPETGLTAGMASLPGCGIAQDENDEPIYVEDPAGGGNLPLLCIGGDGEVKDSTNCIECYNIMNNREMCMTQVKDGAKAGTNCTSNYLPRSIYSVEEGGFQHQATYCGLKEARLSYWCGNTNWNEYNDDTHRVEQTNVRDRIPRFHMYDYENHAKVDFSTYGQEAVAQSADKWRTISNAEPGLSYTPVEYFNWRDGETPWSQLLPPNNSMLNPGQHARSSGGDSSDHKNRGDLNKVGINGNVASALGPPFIMSDINNKSVTVESGYNFATPMNVFESRNMCFTRHAYVSALKNHAPETWDCTVEGRNSNSHKTGSWGVQIDRCNSGRYTQISQLQAKAHDGWQKYRRHATYVCA